MVMQYFNQQKPSNVLPFKKNQKRVSTRTHSNGHASNNKTYRTLKGLLNLPIQTVKIAATLLFLVTASLFQTLLRIAYGGILTIGIVLLAFAGILALFASGRTPANFWPSVWQGESVLLLLALGGFLLDGVLIILQITIGASRASKHQNT